MAADNPYYIVGGTYRFYITVTKDQTVWSLVTATVTVILVDPNGVEHIVSPTIITANLGVFQYITVPLTDLPIPGCWALYCHIVDAVNSIDNKTERYEFMVYKP